MRRCDSVIQKYVVGGRRGAESSREIYSFFDTSVSMAFVQKREKGGRSVLACAKSECRKQGAIEQFLELGFAAIAKT